VRRSAWRWIASGSLIALIFLCVLWESLLAPMRSGGTLLTLKALPLMACLFGILRGRVYTYQWSSMLVLLYFAEGVVRGWSEAGIARWLACSEVLLALTFFFSGVYFVKLSAKLRIT
jgi:uncharacterized membrane protein